MRNDSCVFANYCERYGDNKCQGCMQASGSISDKAEELRKQRSKRATELILSDRYKNGWSSNGIRLTYCGDDQKLQKETNMTIKNVYFNEPITVVLWADGTKTIVKCQDGDTYSKESGLAVAIAKKALGNKGNFNEVFKKWIPEYGKDHVSTAKPIGHVCFTDGTKETIVSCTGAGTNDLKFQTKNGVYRCMRITDISTNGVVDRVSYRHHLKCDKSRASIDTIDTIDYIEFETEW